MRTKPRQARADWCAGIARADITPRESIWLAGWGGRTKSSQGVSHPIWAKAIALKDRDGNLGVIVTSDLLGFSATMTAEIVGRAKKRYGLNRSQLILNASHNHSGPVTGDVLFLYFTLDREQERIKTRYTKWLLDRIEDLIGEAIRDLQPARLQFGQGLAGVGVNRRRARTNGRRLAQVVDQDVPVLSVTSPGGQLRGIVFGYGCHPTCIEDGKVNGDWPGYAQSELESMHPGVTALFMQNCGGDINPLPRFRPGLGERYGFIVAAAVEQVLESHARDQQISGQAQGGKARGLAGPLRMAFAEPSIPFLRLPTRQELQSLLAGRDGMRRREVEYQLSLLKNGDRRPRALRYPVHVWQFGDGLKFIALSSETVTDYSLRFKKEYGADITWVSGYNDDYWSYIPSRRVWEEGGYEGHTGMMECSLPGPFAPSVEEIIAETVDDLVQQTSGKPRPYPKPSLAE